MSQLTLVSVRTLYLQWFMKEYFSRNDMPTSQKFWSRGEGWQTIRRLIQHQLLLPGAAKSYGDAIGAAVEIASKGAPTCGTPDKFHGYLMRASFDMFCAAFHGRLTKCAGADGDEGSRADPLDLAFCQAASNVLTANMPLFLQSVPPRCPFNFDCLLLLIFFESLILLCLRVLLWNCESGSCTPLTATSVVCCQAEGSGAQPFSPGVSHHHAAV